MSKLAERFDKDLKNFILKLLGDCGLVQKHGRPEFGIDFSPINNKNSIP